MVVVAGTILFESQEARDAAIAASVDVQRATRAEEPGCLAYCFAADPAEPTVIQVYELWEDDASLQAHFAHPNYTEMRGILRRFPRAGASVTAKHLVAASSPVYRPDGTPTGDFTS